MHLSLGSLLSVRHASLLCRCASFTFGVISLALISLSLSERDWMDGISIYIVSVGCINILAVWVPPYPNLIYDGIFVIAWALATVFSLLVTVLKSTCYGIANESPNADAVACPKYKAMVVMCFITFLAWVGSTSLAVAEYSLAIYKNLKLKKGFRLWGNAGHPEHRRTEVLENSTATVPHNRRSSTANHVSINKKESLVEDRKPLSKEGKAIQEEKRPTSDKIEVHHAEHQGDEVIVSTPAVELPSLENQDMQSNDSYVHVSGLFADFILAYWLRLVILGVGIVVIIVPILIIYAVPAFALYIVDNIALPDNLTGTFTTFNEHNLTLDVTTMIKVPLTVKVRIEPADIILFNPETLPNAIPVAHIRTTELHFQGGQIVAASGQSLQIGNQTEWERLWRKFFFHDTYGLGVKGKLQVRLGPLKTHVNVLRTFTFQGVVNSSVLALDYLKIQPPDQNGCNIALKIHLTNPSPLQINSNASFEANVFIGDTVLAKAFIDPFVLLRHATTVTAAAKVDLSSIVALVSNFSQIAGAEIPYLGRSMAAITIQGTSISQGGHTWPYWIAGAQGIKLPAAVEITPAFGYFVDDILGSVLTGNSLLVNDPKDSVISVDVTAINELLKNITILDATTV